MSFETPLSLKIKRGTIIPLEKGWKKKTLYLVDAAFSSNNVIQERLFYSGFLASGIPAGYNGFAIFGCSDMECFKLQDAYYVKVIREINKASDDNDDLLEDINLEHLKCAGGACPL